MPVMIKKKNPLVHPVVTNFDELPIESKQICREIRISVNDILPQAEVYLFGSRINGRWTDESDFDIIVKWLPTYEERNRIKSIDFGRRVDIWFTRNGRGVRI